MNEDSKPGRARAIGAEEIETTGGEKLLAVVLAIFIVIGAFWAYDRIDQVDQPTGSQLPQVAREDRTALEKGRGQEGGGLGRGPPLFAGGGGYGTAARGLPHRPRRGRTRGRASPA